MSKRLGNIIDPGTVIPRYGADAVRLFLITSSQLWTPRRFDENGIRDSAAGFCSRSRTSTPESSPSTRISVGAVGTGSGARDRPLLDRGSSRLATVEREADELLALRGDERRQGGDDVLRRGRSKWYVRQSRHRFYDVEEKTTALLLQRCTRSSRSPAEQYALVPR